MSGLVIYYGTFVFIFRDFNVGYLSVTSFFLARKIQPRIDEKYNSSFFDALEMVSFKMQNLSWQRDTVGPLLADRVHLRQD